MAWVLLLALLAQQFSSASVDDAATLERMHQYEVYLREQMARLIDMEQRNMGRSWMDIPTLLFPLLHYWKIWFWIGMLFLSLWIMWQLHKRNQCDQHKEEVESEQEEEEWVEQEEEETEEEEMEQEDEEEGEGDEDFYESEYIRQITERALAKVQGKDNRCQLVEELISNLLDAFTNLCSDSFFPVLLPAIGVGSAFEGWSPPRGAIVYSLLVPMQAPRGHVFIPEVGTKGKALSRKSRVRVEQLCTDKAGQLPGNVPCFLHNAVGELHRIQQPSLLHTLCTGYYLDVQKIVTWFNVQVPTVWTATPHAHTYKLQVLPFCRSCKLQLKDTSSGEKLLIELLFGVQQGHSDIFLSSQNSEAGFTPSTVWPQSFAVAEKKLFHYVARKAGPKSCHLSCLRFFAHIQARTDFSIHTIKTVFFHLLTTDSLKSWHRRDFVTQLQNILQHLQSCLKEKRLKHFFLGNRKVPKEIVLPRNFRAARPLNLFHNQKKDTNACCKVLRDFWVLRNLFRLQLFHAEGGLRVQISACREHHTWQPFPASTPWGPGPQVAEELHCMALKGTGLELRLQGPVKYRKPSDDYRPVKFRNFNAKEESRKEQVLLHWVTQFGPVP
ncbi:inositol 1,4,5-trisphosphate receptor-interacting protein-like 1 [Cyrtonyx montezumae]|uniref:inositol 1,4,5-trisphosphate receptor-interacting protein-like 1 n=1 Tax=Cyrtonyx montezumae TaxID=9017 RepID=UPI0032DB4778